MTAAIFSASGLLNFISGSDEWRECFAYFFVALGKKPLNHSSEKHFILNFEGTFFPGLKRNDGGVNFWLRIKHFFRNQIQNRRLCTLESHNG